MNNCDTKSGRHPSSCALHGAALSQTGNTTVFKASPEKSESLGLNELEERTNSSIAVADGDLFIRTHEALWRITSPTRN